MLKVYIVTGTPGTGKTTFAKKYALEHNLEYIDGNDVVRSHNLSEGYDPEHDSYIVDEKKFAKVCREIIKKSKKDLIIDSHLSHYISPKFVDTCFVITCDLKVLKKRLEDRKYSPEKVRENLDAEIFRVCETEARESGHSVILIE